ncbi:hypothetical protein ACFE04_023444 [Oxalis oulophora]
MRMRVCRSEILLPFFGMIIVTLAQVGNIVIGKMAMNQGTNKYIIILYSDILSTIILLPSSLIIHRSSLWSSVDLSTLGKIFLLAVFGLGAQIFGYTGVQCSSPTLNTAMVNLVPAFTFILALIFRMEKLEWRKPISQAKCLGTLVSIAGAFIVIFYKGVIILKTSLYPTYDSQLNFLSSQSNWILGGLLLAGEALMIAAFYIVQALIFRTFQALFIIMFYLYLFGTLLSAMFSLIVVKDSSDWKLRPDMGLVAILYSAVIATTFRVTLCTWCLFKTGPLYVSMFTPIEIVFAVIMGFILLSEALHIGSVIGAIIVVMGFYLVMWGKAKEVETKEDGQGRESESPSDNQPLMQNQV